MHQISSTLALASVLSTVSAAFQGFNIGNKYTDGTLKVEADYKAEFQTAQGLEGTNGAFNSARLYTMLQDGSSDAPIQAIPAAIDTKTSLLLGMWASAGDAAFETELAALKNAIDTYGDKLASLVAGISIGSEDLYRISPTGIANGEFAGASPDTLVKYINQVRELITGTPLEGAKLGHVDTWTAYVNASNQAVIDACDWLGMDAYPYFESTHANAVSNGRALFNDALGATQGAAGDKEVWITETGWPVSGDDVGDAVPSLENAEKFWKEVGCPMFGSTNVWWYTLQDSSPTTPNPSFGVVSSELTTTPLYDLSCEGVEIPNDEDNSDNKDDATGEDSKGKNNDGVSDSSSGADSGSSGSSSASSNSDADVSSESTDGGETTVSLGSAGRLSVGTSIAALVALAALL